MTWAVVVPTVRPRLYEEFTRAWDRLFFDHDVHVYPVRDEPESWATWPSWVPRQTDMCRSLGFYEAWRDGHDFILSLDDDVRPLPGIDVFAEYEDAFNQPWPCSPYLSVGALTDSGREMRGFPYSSRDARCMVQYGGWAGVLDYDGQTQLAGVPESAAFANLRVPVPYGAAVTTCSMNMAWRREFTPCMWQLPVLGDRYKRFGDIWSGLIQKRVLDARGEVMLVNGRASVVHARASDPAKNAALEQPGMEPNEGMWDVLPDEIDDLESIHWAFAESLPEDYREHFYKCSDAWLELFA